MKTDRSAPSPGTRTTVGSPLPWQVMSNPPGKAAPQDKDAGSDGDGDGDGAGLLEGVPEPAQPLRATARTRPATRRRIRSS